MPIRPVETISGPSLTGLRCPGVINCCRTPMRSTQGGTASSVRTTIRDVSVRGQRIRVAGRPGSGGGTPLVLCCGLGAGLEVLQALGLSLVAVNGSGAARLE